MFLFGAIISEKSTCDKPFKWIFVIIEWFIRTLEKEICHDEKLEALLENSFNIRFDDKRLLETAFTHTSYANEHRLLNISHNERLEFLETPFYS